MESPQHLGLLVAHRVRLEPGGRLHGGQGEELHHVVLEDVAPDAGALEVPRAPLDPHGLRHRDLHLIHVAVVPERLEDPVPQAEDQDVLDGLFDKIVVDPQDLALGEDRVDQRVQLARGFEVVAEGFLDDDPLPGRGALLPDGAPRETGGPDVPDQGLVRGGRGGEIENPVSRDAALLLDLGEELSQRAEGVVILEDAGHVVERLGEALPLGRGRLRRGDGLPHLLPERLARERAAREAHDRGARMEELLLREAEERWDQLPVGEVPARAEDDEGAGIRGFQRDALLAERVLPSLGRGRHGHAVFTGWPPNLWRSAASTLPWKDSACRERNRVWSAAVSTGAGTARSIDSITVHRPSPESST